MTKKKKKQEEEIEYLSEPSEAPPEEDVYETAAPPAIKGGEKKTKSAIPVSAKTLKDKLKKKEADVKRLTSEVQHLKEEAEGLKEQFLRKLADMENLRKRLEREKNDFFKYGLSDILKDLLEILDNFERALQSAKEEPDGKTLKEGVELIYRQYQSFLLKKGVSPIELKDKTFDPAFHHAMTMEESEDIDEPEVLEELQKGYMLHDRLLRPTLVKVAVPKKDGE